TLCPVDEEVTCPPARVVCRDLARSGASRLAASGSDGAELDSRGPESDRCTAMSGTASRDNRNSWAAAMCLPQQLGLPEQSATRFSARVLHSNPPPALSHPPVGQSSALVRAVSPDLPPECPKRPRFALPSWPICTLRRNRLQSPPHR